MALALGAEIISADSMQVYRGMDIGTAKPTLAERRGVPHHLIDIVEPSEDHTVAAYAEAGRSLIESSERPLIISGGSGLHFRALVDPMSFPPTDPEVRARVEALPEEELVQRLLSEDPSAGDAVDLANRRRVVRAVEVLELTGLTPSARAGQSEAEALLRYEPRYPFQAIGIDPGPLLDERIERRMSRMMDLGLVEEVAGLWDRMGRTARAAVNYRQIGMYLAGECDLDEAVAEAIRATRKLARRQRTWFGRDPRVAWIPWTPDPSAMAGRILEAL